MKNGEPRSEKWIARHLPAYIKDNEDRKPENIRDMLSMVSHDVPPEVIKGWTDEQRLLADDWALNQHYRVSDNINRVPARPDFLQPYERTYHDTRVP